MDMDYHKAIVKTRVAARVVRAVIPYLRDVLRMVEERQSEPIPLACSNLALMLDNLERDLLAGQMRQAGDK